LTGWLCACSQAQGTNLLPVATSEESWRFEGTILENVDISSVVMWGNGLVIGADEGHVIQVLKEDGAGRYVAHEDGHIPLAAKDKKIEVDVEAMAWDAGVLYVCGSHCRIRERVKPDEETVADNRKRLRKNERQRSRERLYRIEWTDNGPRVSQSVSLQDLIEDDKHLEDAVEIPSKENGVDIEGLAVGGTDELLIGFRGPVFRGNYVPVMALDTSDGFKEDKLDHELRFVNLGGRGIRGMTEAGDRFLLIGGPVGDEAMSYVLYAWDGKDAMPGTDDDGKQHVVPLCEIPVPNDGAKAEGIQYLGETAEEYRFLVVYDSAANGAATVYSCPKR